MIAAYSVTGGSPPPTLESLRVLEDGRARAIVTSAWPDGDPLDEAGLYELALDADRLERVRALAADPELLAQAGEHGEVRADSGRSSLRLGDAKIVWGAFTEPAPVVARAAKELRALLDEVRRHPIAAVRMALVPGDDGLELELSNPGAEPVGVALLRPRIAASDGEPSLSLYRAAAELDELGDATLAGGERRRIPVSATLPAIAFATATLQLPDSAALDGFLVSRSG